eukprot:Nitzschia sp. Nitz4//scaffold81_size91200//35588//36898//NITZ4_004985-RA/size91200-processed-gene-0.105-mRNA-1//1//CDS//3329558707//7598//frame0
MLTLQRCLAGHPKNSGFDTFGRFYLRLAVILLLVNTQVASEQAYPKGCVNKDSSYYDYEKSNFPPNDILKKSPDDFMLLRRLGAGKFSDVFEAVDVSESRRVSLVSSTTPSMNIDPKNIVALKCLKPVAERKVKRELLVLKHASKLPNLVRLRALVVPSTFFDADKRLRLQEMPSLALEHAGLQSTWFCHKASENSYLSMDEIRFFLYHLLVALDFLHASGIMHRDVKPRNVLIDTFNKSLMLIDLGLADFYLPDTQYNVRVASRHYKAPELLLGNQNYDYCVDLWGVGCILAGLLFRREPFFRGKDNLDQLGTIMAVLGTSDLERYISNHHLEVSPETRSLINLYTANGYKKRKSWKEILSVSLSTKHDKQRDAAINPPPILDQQSLDLLSKLLVYDHSLRLTAKQAMQHPFFDSVRTRVNKQIQEQLLQLHSAK